MWRERLKVLVGGYVFVVGSDHIAEQPAQPTSSLHLSLVPVSHRNIAKHEAATKRRDDALPDGPESLLLRSKIHREQKSKKTKLLPETRPITTSQSLKMLVKVTQDRPSLPSFALFFSTLFTVTDTCYVFVSLYPVLSVLCVLSRDDELLHLVIVADYCMYVANTVTFSLI